MAVISSRKQRAASSGQQPRTSLVVMPDLTPFVPLGTPRLSLVALTLDHAPGVFAYAGDPEISRLVSSPRHENLEDSRRWVARSMAGYQEGGHYDWGLLRRADKTFLGTCGFGEIDVARGAADIGFVLARPYWGQGYATEAAVAVLQFGFGRLGLRRITAHAFPENAASLRVLTKLGLRYCETQLVRENGGVSRPVCVWQIERRRWAEGALRRPPPPLARKPLPIPIEAPPPALELLTKRRPRVFAQGRKTIARAGLGV